MAITLKCSAESGSVSLPREIIAGFPLPDRHYDIIDGEVTLDGWRDVVLQHDMLLLLAMPNGMYRMYTPTEQRVKAEALRQAATVEEVAPVAPVVEEAPVITLKKTIGG